MANWLLDSPVKWVFGNNDTGNAQTVTTTTAQGFIGDLYQSVGGLSQQGHLGQAASGQWVEQLQNALAQRRPINDSDTAVAVADAPEKEPTGAPAIDQEYRTLAAKLGVVTKELTRETVLDFLRKECMGTYDPNKVDQYLRGIASKEGKVWIWKPLRDKDIIQGSSWQPMINGQKISEVYHHAVPYPVLLTVDKIQAEFPGAKFFVSDYEVAKPDPFLMVMINGEQFIVERWDEPSFR